MDQAWVPEFRCCWCAAKFVRDTIFNRTTWVCPTEVCRERQLAWKILDEVGNLFYLPNPRQVEVEEAVASRQFAAICFGGARGGSKSVAWRRIAQRYCRTLPGFTVLFLRRELKPLQRNHLRFIHREAAALGGKFVSMKLSFQETDSEIEFGHCQDPDDYKNYVGAEADLVIFEQLEQFTELQFAEISAVAGRSQRDDWRGLIAASENPNGPLSSFVDTVFVKKDVDLEKYPYYDPADYKFIYSHLEDNPHVPPDYVRNLARMSKEKREMYRFGNRDVFPDQFFKTFDATQHVVSLA